MAFDQLRHDEKLALLKQSNNWKTQKTLWLRGEKKDSVKQDARIKFPDHRGYILLNVAVIFMTISLSP